MKVRDTHSGFDGTRSRSVLGARVALAAMVTVVVVGTALGTLFLRPATYSSTASVLVNPVPARGAAPQPVDMATEKAIVASAAVLTEASSDLGLPLSTVADSLSVDVPVDTRILEITSEAATATEARRRAGAIARAYVTYRVDAYPPASQQPRRARSAEAAAPATVLTPPNNPSGPARPDPIMVLAAALVVGLGLGVGAALLRDHLDDTIRDAADLQAVSGLRVLAVVPRPARSWRRRLDGRGVSDEWFRDEAFRPLCARILSLLDDAPPRILLVTSTAQPAPARAVASALSLALAAARPGVVLLTAPGEEVPMADDAESRRAPTVRSIPLDFVDPRPTLETVTGASSLVVIQAPTPLTGADTWRVAELADAILLVEQRGASTRRQVRVGLEVARDVAAEVIGAVLIEPARLRNGRDLPAWPAPKLWSKRSKHTPAASDRGVRS